MSKVIVADRAIVYDEDILNTNRNAEITDGAILQLILAEGEAASGFDCVPTSPPTMSVLLKAGGLTSLTQIDSADYGAAGSDSNLLQKIGWNREPELFSLSVSGLSVGQSKYYLIQGKFVEEDTDYVDQEYFDPDNIDNPTVGPPIPKTRKTYTDTVLLEGSPATTGSQQAPTPSAGYTGLWLIEVRYGDTSIQASRITKHSDFPSLSLGGGGSGYQNIKVFDVPGANSWVVPAGVTSVRAVVGGAGGGGGGAYANGGAGGGGGGQKMEAIVTVSSGATISITVGAGGAGGTNTNGSSPGTQAPGNSGGNGGSSSFGTYVTAVGGVGGMGAGNDIASPGGNGGNSGTVANTVTSFTFQHGGSGDTGFIPSGLDGGRGGKGGDSGLGGGSGRCGIGTFWSTAGLPSPGNGYGGGGGGGGSGNLGAAGANGVVILYW